MVNLYFVSLKIKPRWSGLLTRIASDLVGRAKNSLVLYGVLSAYDKCQYLCYLEYTKINDS